MVKISAEEKENATLVPLDRILSGEDDVETAFNEFRESFHTGDEPGVVRAWELTIDERGNVGTTRMQNRLGSWPIDAYKFDELCGMLIEQYMEPGQLRMAVRLVGTRKEQTGYIFNKIVMLKRALKKESSSAPVDNTASIMKAMQEMNERTMEMFKRMQPVAVPPEKVDSMAELQKLIAISAALNNPMMTMMQSLLPALVGRPVPAAGDPFAGITGILEVAEKLSDLRGGGSGGGDDDSFAGILRAITPLAKPALEALPAIASMQAASRPAPRVIAAPAPKPAPPLPPGNGAAPAPKPAPPTGAPTQPTDIPSGDTAMLAQLKPQIDSLVTMATQGSDATQAADMIFDQVFMDPRLPDELYEKLADFIDSPQFVNYVCVMNPAAKPHAAWFDSFKAEIVRRLNEEEIEPADPTVTPPIANAN